MNAFLCCQVKPKLKGKARMNASRGSFFARDNVAMFLKFCRDLGVHNNLLFETEDLGEGNVIL